MKTQEPHISNEASPELGRRSWRMLPWMLLLLLILACSIPFHNEATNIIARLPDTSALKPAPVKQVRALIKDHAARYQLHGIDLARYQKKVDWNTLDRTGIDFVFIKSTEGVGLVDSFFTENWQQARQNGIRRGAYHYFLAEKDPKIQAVHFIVNTDIKKDDLPPVLDVEVTRQQSPRVIRAHIRQWLEMVENAYGKKPIIYTNFYFYDKYLSGYFEEYPLWIADYRGEKAEYSKYRQWRFWQHTDSGHLDGIREKVDFNVFRGTIKELDSLCQSRITVNSNIGKALLRSGISRAEN